MSKLLQLEDILKQLISKKRKTRDLKEQLLSEFLDNFEPTDLSSLEGYSTAFKMLEKATILINDRIEENIKETKKLKHTYNQKRGKNANNKKS